MRSNRSNPSQFRVSHLRRQSTVQLSCMATVWYCTVWLLGTTIAGYGTVWLSFTVWLYNCMVLGNGAV
eukprot:COSAG05_NODE_2677_length_2775_cov_27.104634_4_plen_68_part_00